MLNEFSLANELKFSYTTEGYRHQLIIYDNLEEGRSVEGTEHGVRIYIL